MASGGKRSTTWTKGKNPVKKPGTKNTLTKVKEAVGLTNWARFKEFVEGEGADKLVNEMMKLRGKDYVHAYASLAEYIKPKLNRTTVEVDPDSGPVIALPQMTFEQLKELKYGTKPGNTKTD